MCDYKTYLIISLRVPSNDDDTEKRYRDGRPLMKTLHREISAPPMFVPGMFVTIGEAWEKVDSIGWDEDKRNLSLYAHRTLYYYNQGPEHLTGQDKIIAWFDNYVQCYIQDNWAIGSPE